MLRFVRRCDGYLQMENRNIASLARVPEFHGRFDRPIGLERSEFAHGDVRSECEIAGVQTETVSRDLSGAVSFLRLGARTSSSAPRRHVFSFATPLNTS